MENLIIFIIFIIFSLSRSLAKSGQATRQSPVSKRGGLPMPPVPGPIYPVLRPRSLTPEFLEAVFETEALKQEKVLRPEKTHKAAPVQTVPEATREADRVFKQDKLFQPQATTLLHGIVYAEVLGLPRGKKRWQPRK